MLMNNHPFVSFCVFSYNQENFILDALNGAVSQEYDNMEIIVSDDCSKDRTQEIIDVFVASYKGNHKIVVNKNTTNMGIAQHVNKVLYEIAKGDIIVVAAGDDKSLPNRVSLTVDYFLRFPEIASLSFLSQAADERLVPRADYDSLSYRPHTYTILTINDYLNFNIGCFSGDSRALRRSVIESFPPLSYALAEDYFLYLRSLMIGSVCYIRENVLLRRLHDNNVSSIVPTRDRCKRNLMQFKADIEWAYTNGYINVLTKEGVLNKTKKITKYSAIGAWRKRLWYFCRRNRMISAIYFKYVRS